MCPFARFLVDVGLVICPADTPFAAHSHPQPIDSFQENASVLGSLGINPCRHGAVRLKNILRQRFPITLPLSELS